MKTRFAPSPTGFLHIGGLRTALFAYLAAKKDGGDFVLRIEDTDRERFVEGGVENILSALDWAGIEIDEGVVMEDGKINQKGNNGPYIQSERTKIYLDHVQKLLESDSAYYCFCTKERLDELRKLQEINKKATGYDGHCRKLPKSEVQENLEAKTSHVIRLKMPEDGETVFDDLVRKKVCFENKLIDDQVLVKSDGFPTYHLAVVVDDYLMGVTLIIRGEEWLPSTPKHIAIYNAFGWEIPKFAHLPLIVNEKKQKLSKRHGDVSVEDFKEKGYLSAAIMNFIAFLGWNPGTDKELFTLTELEKEFSFEKISKSAAVFNREKLDWYNKQYMAQVGNKELAKLAKPFFKNNDLDSDDTYLEKVVALEQGRANTLKEIVDSSGYLFAENLDYEPELLIWKKSDGAEAKKILVELNEFLSEVGEWDKESLEKITFAWIEEKRYKNGNVLWPMRVALSGQKNSPGPFEIADVLGKEKSLVRLKEAEAKL